LSILLFIVLGLNLGLLARALFPGQKSMGVILTAVLGMIGSLVGGPVANLLAGRPLLDVNAAAFVGSVICGVALLVAVAPNDRPRRLV
jgi:uncharacterized membrane protein YeaQ/YmgE (transglycosylase-associated protein family)